MRFLPLALICFLPQPKPETISGIVVGISDGDTLTILDADKKQHKIRLHGIDSPEKGQPFGDRAKHALSEKVFKKRILAVKTDLDRYGRTVAEVYVDDRLINQEMVSEGWAWHYVKYSDSEALADAEEKARSKNLGLWGGQKPIPPWK
ncbi:MAG: thermonuclease family protein [Planctomycetaceae bacterium]|nr:thermonuclease family protein [Planctomycetaceae bacterium]